MDVEISKGPNACFDLLTNIPGLFNIFICTFYPDVQLDRFPFAMSFPREPLSPAALYCIVSRTRERGIFQEARQGDKATPSAKFY